MRHKDVSSVSKGSTTTTGPSAYSTINSRATKSTYLAESLNFFGIILLNLSDESSWLSKDSSIPVGLIFVSPASQGLIRCYFRCYEWFDVHALVAVDFFAIRFIRNFSKLYLGVVLRSCSQSATAEVPSLNFFLRFIALLAIGLSVIGLSVSSVSAMAESLVKTESPKLKTLPPKKTTVEIPGVETLLVTGSRIAQSSSPATLLLDAGEIKLRNGANAANLLRNLPGIDVIQPGGPGGITELFIRGAESNFTLVTIDGVRVNDITNSRGGSFDLSALNPDDIERVEIHKGPLSALYGSDALAGALNIITKTPSAEAPVSLRAELGSDNYQRAYASVSGVGDNGFASKIAAAYLDSGEPVEGSSAKTQSVRQRIDWTDENDRRLDFLFSYVERERSSLPTGSGGNLYAASPALEYSKAEDESVSGGWREQVSESFLFDLRANYFKRDEQVTTPMIPDAIYSGAPAMSSDSTMERNTLVTHGVYQLTSTVTAAFGVEYKDESGRSDAILDFGFPVPDSFDLHRVTKAAFFEGRYQEKNGTDFLISSRLDKTEDFSTESSSKVFFSYPLSNHTRIGASWGEAYKLPSFYAVGDALVGNPRLLPETSETKEVMVTHEMLGNRIKISATAFDSTYDQLIDFDFASFTLVNRADIRVKGMELEMVVNPLRGFESGAHATRTDYERTLHGRPDWRGGLYFEWSKVSAWSARLHYIFVGDRTSASSATGEVTLDSYQKVDAVVIKTLTTNADVSLSLDNIFAEEYQEEVGFISPGRALRLGLSAKF